MKFLGNLRQQKAVKRLWECIGGKPKMLTDRLLISPLNVEDAENYLALIRVPQVVAYMGHDSSDITLSQVEGFLRTGAAAGYSYALKTKQENRFIGVCGRSKSQILSGFPDIFIYIHPAFWRNGYAREALEQFIYFLLVEEKMRGVTARVKKGNQASEQLMETIAMAPYGKSTDGTETFYRLDRDWYLSNVVY